MNCASLTFLKEAQNSPFSQMVIIEQKRTGGEKTQQTKYFLSCAASIVGAVNCSVDSNVHNVEKGFHRTEAYNNINNT